MTETAQIISLFKTLRDDTSILVKQELALAKSEVKEKADFMSRQVIYIVAGALVGFAAFIILLMGLSTGLGSAFVEGGMNPDVAIWLAPALVGAIVLAVAAGAVMKGVKSLSADNLKPRKTMESLEDNKNWAERKLG